MKNYYNEFKLSNEEILAVINDYLDRGMGSTIEQVILRRAAFEIQEARRERDHLITQLINMGVKPNVKPKQ